MISHWRAIARETMIATQVLTRGPACCGTAGPVAAMVASSDRASASVDLVIDQYYSDDREDRDELASPSHLSGRSLAEL